MTLRSISKCRACGVFALPLVIAAHCSAQSPASAKLHAGKLTMQLRASPFRYSFTLAGKPAVDEVHDGSLLIDGKPAVAASLTNCEPTHCELRLQTSSGDRANLSIWLTPHHATLKLSHEQPGLRVEFRSRGAAPGFGLSDHAFLHAHYNTDVTGFTDDHFLSGEETSRLVSNFIIYPRQHFAVLLVDPTTKIIHSSAKEIVQGVTHAATSVPMHYFFGNPHEIYGEYRDVRISSGAAILTPKPALFGVGWEAFGALGWKSDSTTVLQSIERYRSLGFPLSFAVIGSGFWPAGRTTEETTSFGLVNHDRYPDLHATTAQLHALGLKVLFGLRIDFLSKGPFTAEGLRDHLFIERNGHAQIFHGGWPKSPYYLLDTQKPGAVRWYLTLIDRWRSFGVDGFKEDYFDFGPYGLRDDKVDVIDTLQMQHGDYVIERNGYLSSNGDIQRINDFNFDQNQDRGPVNALAFAYSGFPLVYPDIVGGTFGEQHFSTTRTPRMERYMMRNALWAALHPSMSIGEPPWSFSNPNVGSTMLFAARLHDRLQPFFYAQALRFSQDGFPWPMTPLPIAYPESAGAYGRENESVRGYEWRIGDSLIATPLYGNDYDTATERDIYLPPGPWIDYDTGNRFQGPVLLHNVPMPVTRTPLFVGGNGIVLEKLDGVVMVRVYRLDPDLHSAKLQLTSCGKPIEIEARLSGPQARTAVDLTTNKPVAASIIRHALQFPIVEGHAYRVE